MKKVILLAGCLAVMSSVSNAQEGSWYIGGNAGFASTQNKVETSGTTVNGEKYSSWSFSPELGTFLSDNVQLGVAFNIAGDTKEFNDVRSRIDRGTMFGGTLYGRYFFNGGAFRPFVGVSVSALPGNRITSVAGTADLKTNTMDLGANLNAGFALALSPTITAVGSFGAVGFQQKTSEVEGSNVKATSNTIGFQNAGTLGQRFTVGIYYTFSK